MTAPLRCTIRRRYPIALLEISGPLQLDTVTGLRTAVLTLLADQPVALVLDLREMLVPDNAMLSALPVLAHNTATWTSTALIVASPDPDVVTALRRRGLHHSLGIHPTLPAALRAASTRPLPSRLRLEFQPDVVEAARARAAVRGACHRWGLPVLQPRAVQIANELVSNTVIHARTPGVLLAIRRSRHLHLSVQDSSAEPPVLRTPDRDGGFGLALVDQMASGWGTRTIPGGKVVWATLRIWPQPDASVR